MKSGAEVIRRPDDISGDTASSESALLHALDVIAVSGNRPEVIVFIQPTSPFIPALNIEQAIVKVRENKFDVIFSAVPFHRFLWQLNGSTAQGLNHNQSERLRRQDRDPDYLETGAFYVMNAEGFRKNQHRFFGRVGLEVMPEHTAIEIDTEVDLNLARAFAATQPSEVTQIPARALVMDFDGVHTDNRAIVDANGSESVTVNRSDGLGIELLRAAGVHLLILSKETVPIAVRRAEKLGIAAACAIDDKATYLRGWCITHDVELADVAYVGNDINDLQCLEIVGWPIAVADAHESVRAAARVVLDAPGGAGAIREIADRILGGGAISSS